MTFVIIKVIGKSVLILVFIMYYAYSIFRDKQKTFLKKALYIIVGGWLIFAVVYMVIPTMFDIKNVIYANYHIVSGNVESWDFSNRDKIQHRSIGIKDEETNQIVTVNIYSTGIEKGEYLQVSYLPCTKYGAIISQGRENE